LASKRFDTLDPVRKPRHLIVVDNPLDPTLLKRLGTTAAYRLPNACVMLSEIGKRLLK
jgi:hypothetical protein